MSWGQKIVFTIVLMIAFGALGWFSHDFFIKFIVSQFQDLHVQFHASSLLGGAPSPLSFSLILALLPALFLFSHFVLKDQKLKVFWVIVPVTLIFGFALVAFHIYSLRSEVSDMSDLTYLFLDMSIPYSELKPARYLGIGFLFGVVLSTAIVSFATRDRKV